MGASEADASEIKAHTFFAGTNWDDVFHKRIPSPFYPAIVRLVPLLLVLLLLLDEALTSPPPALSPLQSSATDTSNFDSEFTSEQPTLTPVHSTLSAQDQGEFQGFSWTANWAQ